MSVNAPSGTSTWRTWSTRETISNLRMIALSRKSTVTLKKSKSSSSTSRTNVRTNTPASSSSKLAALMLLMLDRVSHRSSTCQLGPVDTRPVCTLVLARKIQMVRRVSAVSPRGTVRIQQEAPRMWIRAWSSRRWVAASWARVWLWERVKVWVVWEATRIRVSWRWQKTPWTLRSRWTKTCFRRLRVRTTTPSSLRRAPTAKTKEQITWKMTILTEAHHHSLIFTCYYIHYDSASQYKDTDRWEQGVTLITAWLFTY